MEYKKGQFLRNKKTQKICKMYWDTKFVNEDIWELWVPKEGEWCWSKGTMVRAFIFQWTKEHIFEEDRYEPWNKNLPFDME